MPIRMLRRFKLRCKDALRYGALPGAVKFTQSLLGHRLALSHTRRAAHLLQAYRFTFREFWLRRLRRFLPEVRGLTDTEVLQLSRQVWKWAGDATQLDKTIILKAPGSSGERGVILSFAEYNWLRLLNSPEAAKEVGERYSLILTAGWSPLDYSLLEALTRYVPGTMFVQPCNRREFDKIHAFSPRFVCLPTLGCDWINPDLYQPKPRDRRSVDIVMVANWGPFKRHWHFFEALRTLPSTLRIHLIGQPDGAYGIERIRQMARDFGVPQQLEFFESLPVEKVQEHLADARVSLILTRHEGYCGAITESLFADTPVGVLHDAFIGSKDYINAQTGMLLPHRRLDHALSEFLSRADSLRPRDWALANITCDRSLVKVNDALRKQAGVEGLPWTKEIAPFCWRPYPVLRQPNEELRRCADDLINRFPSVFNQGLVAQLPSG